MTALTQFDNRNVIATPMALTNAGDGLSKAMSVEPNELSIGETVYVVIEAEVSGITYQPVKDTDALVRKHTLRAGTATFVDESLVRDLLDEQERKIEESNGVHRLEYTEGDPDPADDDTA